jgi:precorrin-8X/cobalt-precorrin-8 methylmutase
VSRVEPHPIEVESYRILRERVDLSGWPEPERAVVARMIHATADESFATTVRVGADAVAAALHVIATRGPIVVDAAMVRAGAPRLDTMCFLDAVPVAPKGSTRSAAAFARAAQQHPRGAMWVVGNAPTALDELMRLHAAGLVEPAAVIGLPVGYVGAADSKAALWSGPLAAISITNTGERGGSAVAAASLNALRRLHEGASC